MITYNGEELPCGSHKILVPENMNTFKVSVHFSNSINKTTFHEIHSIHWNRYRIYLKGPIGFIVSHFTYSEVKDEIEIEDAYDPEYDLRLKCFLEKKQMG